MGILRYAMVGNYKKFYEQLGEISKENGKSKQLMFIDTAICTLILGSGLQDYLNYKFYEKNWKERKKYFTIGQMAKEYKVLAPYKYAEFISNKVNFHKNYSEFTKRKCVSVEDGYDSIQDFIDSHEYFIVKPVTGLGGTNVTKFHNRDIKSKSDLYQKLKDENLFIEEFIEQDENWGKLNPNSTNTIRIMTTVVRNNVKIIFAGARIGSGKSVADNFHQGGRAVLVDIENGKLVGNALDKNLKEYEKNDNNIIYNDFQIPYWNEIKDMVKMAALVNPNIHIVGWDVAISKDGPLIIEGNRGPGFDLVQVLLNKGAKYMIDELKEELSKEYD